MNKQTKNYYVKFHSVCLSSGVGFNYYSRYASAARRQEVLERYPRVVAGHRITAAAVKSPAASKSPVSA